MLTYDLDARESGPKYRYLYRCIRHDIRTGTLAEGARLPSKRTLASHLAVSVSTVEQAYDLLVSEGYVYAKPHSGFFVAAGRMEGGAWRDDDTDAADEAAPTIDLKANRESMGLFPAESWSRVMRGVLADRDDDLLDTIPFNGLAKLRASIAGYLREFRGISASPARIVVGAGTEYLYGKLLQLFGPTAVIAMADPGYKKLALISRGAGTLWEHIPVDEEGISIDGLRRGRADVVHVSPANVFPLGFSTSAARRAALLDWVRERPQRYLIEDDYDSEFDFDSRPQPPLFTQDDSDSVIYLNTFSKTLVPSIRISYMVLPERLMSAYRDQLSFYSCTVSSFEQLTLARFIDEGYYERHVNRLRRHYREARERMLELVEASPLAAIATVRRPSVGTHLLLSVDTRLSDSEVRRAAAERGMSLAMLSDYCEEPTVRTSQTVVLNYASISSERAPGAIDLLADVFRDDIARVRRREARN